MLRDRILQFKYFIHVIMLYRFVYLLLIVYFHDNFVQSILPFVNLLHNMFSIDRMSYVNFISASPIFPPLYYAVVCHYCRIFYLNFAPCRAAVVCHARFVFNKLTPLVWRLGTLKIKLEFVNLYISRKS